MQPTRAALEKFGEDASRWDESSGMLADAQAAASRLTIDPLAFGPAALLGVAERYQQVQQMIVDRLGEGATEFESISTNLIQARDDIRRTDEAGADDLHSAANGG